MTPQAAGVVALVGAVVTGGCSPAFEAGRAAFAENCAECHGAAGHGDGPLSTLVPGGVPDLTGLSLRAGGPFPKDQVVQLIDSGSSVHGRLVAMPDFGGLLAGPRRTYRAADGTEIVTAAALLDIVAYLESIQR